MICRAEDIVAFSRKPNPTESVLRDLGNKGLTVRDLLILLDKSRLEKAQLLLRRKFCKLFTKHISMKVVF